MTALNLIRALTACAAAGALLLAVPASACETGNCETIVEATPSQATPSKPLQLNSFKRKPVATSATRTVKKKDGAYAKVALKPRTKQKAAGAPAMSPVLPETISPAAAQAFASYELARVRVISPEETSRIANAVAATDTAVVTVDNVQVVGANEVNEIDRKADSPQAVSLDSLSRDLAGNAAAKVEEESWLQRMLVMLGSAFAAVAALTRTLLG